MSRRRSSGRNSQWSRSICPYPETIVTRLPISWPSTRRSSSAVRPASGSSLVSRTAITSLLSSGHARVSRRRLHDLDESLDQPPRRDTLLQIGDGAALEGHRRHARLLEPGEDDHLGGRRRLEDAREGLEPV